jgi:hypothetical protein
MPSFGQYALDVVDETGRCTAHQPRQDQVGEPPAGDVRKCAEESWPGEFQILFLLLMTASCRLGT